MKIAFLLALVTTAVSAGNLIEVAAVSKDSVPDSREMIRTIGDHAETIHVMKSPMITTVDVEEVSIGADPLTPHVKLSVEGAKKFAAQTRGMEGQRIAMIVQGKVMMAPVIRQAPLGGLFELSGFKDAAEAKAFVEAFYKERG